MNNHANQYGYPNATLLKSPRLLNYDLKKQYTPPPMLSPFRKGPGLFYNPKHFPMFLLPFMNNTAAAAAAVAANLNSSSSNRTNFANNPLMLNHSLSYSYPSTSSNFAHLNSLLQQQNSARNARQSLHHQSESFHDEYRESDGYYDDKMTPVAKKQKLEVYEEEDEELQHEKQPSIENEKPSSSSVIETLTSQSSSVSEEMNEEAGKPEQQAAVELSASSSSAILKPSLMRSRLLSQISNSSGGCAFFPDESANEAITAALIDCAEINTKP